MSGISDGLFPFIYAVVFRYGAFAVTVDSDNVASLDYRDLITLVYTQYKYKEKFVILQAIGII